MTTPILDLALLGVLNNPLKLRPLPANGRGGDWGKRDEALAAAVLKHMIGANPPIVLQWTTHMAKIRRCVGYNRGVEMLLEDLHKLIPERFPPAAVITEDAARRMLQKYRLTYPEIAAHWGPTATGRISHVE